MNTYILQNLYNNMDLFWHIHNAWITKNTAQIEQGCYMNIPLGRTFITDLHLPLLSIMQNQNKYLLV